MSTKIKTAVTAFGSAVVTAMLLFTVFATYGLYPFGDKSLSWCDMNQQVVPLLMDFKDILSGNSNILLNMQNAGGMNFWGVFFFFLASPFSLLVIFVEKADMIQFMNILVLLKMAFSAVTASIFFSRYFKKLPVLGNIALSISYAFCGFALFFYQNIIWLDMMWSFPLLLMSIYRLLEYKKPTAFVFMLSLSMVMNYYIGYMLVVFILIGVPLWILLCTATEDKKRVSMLFIISCLIAALLTSVVWMPSLIQYFGSARGGDIMSSLASGDLFDRYTTKSPILYCTPVIFAILPFISFKDAIEKRKLICVFLMFGLILIASVFEPINKMWQTGNYMSFPLRYGYMIAFVGLILAAHVINNHSDNGRSGGTPIAFFWSALCVTSTYTCEKILTDDYFGSIAKYTSSLWGDERSFKLLTLWVFVAIFAITVLVALMRNRHISKRVFSVFLCLTVFTCSLFNGGVYIGSAARSDDSYRTEMELANKISDGSFYRVKSRNKYFVVNQIGAMGYNSLSHYTSLTDESYMFAMKKLGYSSYWMEVNSNGGTLLTDAILRNQYTVSKNGNFNFSNDVIYQNESYCIIKSIYDMPAAVKLSSIPEEYALLPDMERCEIQDYLYRLYSGTDDSVITRYEHISTNNVDFRFIDGIYSFDIGEGSNGKLSYSFLIEGKQSLYFDAFKDISNNLKEKLNDSFSVSVNGSTVQSSYPSQSSNGLLYLGDYEDEYVYVTVNIKKDAVASSFGVFSMNADKIQELCESISGCDIDVSGNRIFANVDGKKGEYLYFALPCTDGYIVKINGKKTELYTVNDSFAAIELEEGKNEIVLTYLPIGFIPAILLGAIGLFMLIGLIIFLKHKKIAISNGIMGKLSLISVYTALISVIILVYVFPILVFIFNGKR